MTPVERLLADGGYKYALAAYRRMHEVNESMDEQECTTRALLVVAYEIRELRNTIERVSQVESSVSPAELMERLRCAATQEIRQ